MRKAIKITLIVIGSLVLLLVAAVLCLNSQWGQNIVRGKAEAFLNDKLKTEVRVGYLGVGFPKFIVIKDVFVGDQARDTLLLVSELKIDLNMMALIRKKVDVQQLVLSGVHSHIYRNLHDTDFNFTYIINAFAGKKTEVTDKPKDTTKEPMKIDIGKVVLNDIHARFDDYTGGTRLAVDLEHLGLKMKSLDLEKMAFHIKDLSVSGLQGHFIQDTSYLPVKPHKEGSTDIQLIADDIDLERIAFKYNDNLNKMLFAVKLGSLQLQLNKFGLGENIVDVEKLAISNTDIKLVMGKNATAPDVVDSIVKIDSTEGWNVSAGDVKLAGVSFSMDNENELRIPKGIDYAHLGLKGVFLELERAQYNSDSLSGRIKHLIASEQSGVEVKELRTVFKYNKQGAVLDELYLETPKTIIRDHLEIHYPSIDSLKYQLALMQLKVNLKKSQVAVSDILLFVPGLEEQKMFKENKNELVKIEAKFAGLLSDLDIKKLAVTGLRNTDVLLSGKLTGLPDAERLRYDLNIAKFLSSARDVSTFVPDSVLAAIRIPDRFGVSGTVSGTVRDYKTNINLTSTDGLAYVKGTLEMSPGKGKERYDMVVSTAELNIGRILRQDSTLGPVSAHFVVKGTGFDPKLMNTTVDGNILSAVAKGYRYHDITFYVKAAAQRGDIDLMSKDPNVRIQLKGHADFSGKYAAAKADLQVDSIDLQALKLYKTELRASGTIHADFPELNPEYPRGTFTWWQPVVNADGKRYYLDSLYVISRPGPDTGQNIYANLGVLTARITGKTPLTKIAPIIQEHISRHYVFPAKDSAGKIAATGKQGPAQKVKTAKVKPADTATLPTDYNLNIVADVIDQPMLRGLLPGLTSFDSIHLNCSLTPKTLILDVTMPNIVYGTTTVMNGVVAVRGTDSAFTYKVTADQISQNKFSLWYADIHGRLGQNTITTNISISDASRTERFALAAVMEKAGDSQVVRLEPGLKLDYKDWVVAQPNRIVFSDGGFYVSNFDISNSGQFIRANNAVSQLNTPLKIDIGNFRLANITQAVSSSDTLLADGVLDGSIKIEKFTPALQVVADLKIRDLAVMGDTLGEMRLLVNNKQEGVLEAKMNLTGQGNDIALNGAYYLKQVDGNDFKFNLDVNALAVRTFETIAAGNIKNSSGYLRGKLELQGTVKAPQVTGELRTDKITTTVTQLNAVFKMPAEKIEFTKEGISFNNFDIHDKEDNKATINGKVDTRNLDNIELDLTIRANKWRALQSTAKDNKLYYGDLLFTTNLNVKGPVSAPSVDGTLKILKGTDVTVVSPESSTGLESRRGIVRFVNMKDTGRRNVLAPRKKREVKNTKASAGSEVNVNVTIDKEATFTLMLEQGSGDFLTVKGEANINAAVTPGGTISLTGAYALNDGAYQLNYNLVKRKFKIAKGSMITFSGDPIKNTILDVTAIYEAQVPPYDLVQRQVADPAQLNFYKQRLPFDIKLFMNGPVLTPRLTFDIALSEGKPYRLGADQVDLVQGKLSQVRTDTSELNKQVFAVLILNRFVSDDPFSSGAGSSASFTAMQSVSTFLGEQLNRAAGKLVKGVDFSVDLATTEDYTSGDLRQRTDLNLAASKQLLNDRLKLTLGNNFELEGAQTNSGSQSSYVPSNLAADYILTADGKYTLRAYRKAYDVGVLQGFVTETGLNLIVSFDYNLLKNAFRSNKRFKEREKRAEQRAEENKEAEQE